MIVTTVLVSAMSYSPREETSGLVPVWYKVLQIWYSGNVKSQHVTPGVLTSSGRDQGKTNKRGLYLLISDCRPFCESDKLYDQVSRSD